MSNELKVESTVSSFHHVLTRESNTNKASIWSNGYAYLSYKTFVIGSRYSLFQTLGWWGRTPSGRDEKMRVSAGREERGNEERGGSGKERIWVSRRSSVLRTPHFFLALARHAAPPTRIVTPIFTHQFCGRTRLFSLTFSSSRSELLVILKKKNNNNNNNNYNNKLITAVFIFFILT